MNTKKYQLQPRPHHCAIAARRRWTLRYLLAVILCACAVPLTTSVTYSAPQRQEQQWVTQKIHYHQDEAGQVVLIWGINDWQLVPEGRRPAGTVVKGHVMYTPMVYEQNTFVVDIQAPAGAMLDYSFNITKTQTGESIDVLDPDGSLIEYYLTSVIPNNIIEVYSIQTLVQTTAFNLPAIPTGYYGIAVLAVVLICAIFWLRRRLRNPFEIHS